MNKQQLINACIDICFYSQTFSRNWSKEQRRENLSFAMEHVSYVISCLIAQNTKIGNRSGVDWDIVHKFLCGPVLTHQQWEEIITNIVEQYND